MHLKDVGTHSIIVTFSGSGDDGGIDEIQLFDFYEKDISTDSIFNKHGTLESPLEQLFYECIYNLSRFEGNWVDDDGGFGTLTINLEINEYELDISFRTTRDHAWNQQVFI